MLSDRPDAVQLLIGKHASYTEKLCDVMRTTRYAVFHYIITHSAGLTAHKRKVTDTTSAVDSYFQQQIHKHLSGSSLIEQTATSPSLTDVLRMSSSLCEHTLAAIAYIQSSAGKLSSLMNVSDLPVMDFTSLNDEMDAVEAMITRFQTSDVAS